MVLSLSLYIAIVDPFVSSRKTEEVRMAIHMVLFFVKTKEEIREASSGQTKANLVNTQRILFVVFDRNLLLFCHFLSVKIQMEIQ